MDTSTGVILGGSELEQFLADHPDAQVVDAEEKAPELKARRRPKGKPTFLAIDPRHLSARNRAQLETTGRTQISRNSPCPCGSRKRFKRCCWTGGEQ